MLYDNTVSHYSLQMYSLMLKQLILQAFNDVDIITIHTSMIHIGNQINERSMISMDELRHKQYK